MKKIYNYVTWVIIALSIVATTSAAGPWGFQVSEVSSKINSCAGAKVNATVYISGSNTSKFVYDEFFSKNRQAISDRSTRIRYWEASNNLISSCNRQSAWQKYSDYSPGGWQRVVATGANCTFNKPTNKNKRNVQFVFNIGYYDITGGSWTPNPKFVYANLSQSYAGTYSTVNLQNISLVNKREHSNECLNVELRYCGDGILSTGEGETCDPEDPLKRGWGNGGCNTNSCQPINTPTCNSLTVNPSSGDAPLDVTATCEWYKVNSFRIDCGNGQVFDGSGSNSGTETFTRTCNYTTANTYTPRCYVNGSISGNSCRKTVTVDNPLVPSIIVDKRDQNIFDIDGTVGDDTQTVNTGEEAVFKIRVRNNGQETLKDIVLIDAQAKACATKNGTVVNLSGKTFTNKDDANVSISFGGSGNHNNNTLEVGEWFEYVCEKDNTQSNYTNVVETRWVWVTSGQTVTDTDPTEVLVNSVTPEINVIKNDANPDDLDGSIGGNDSQTVNVWDKAVFHITVENTGTEDLEDITLIDALADACASDGFVNLSGKTFTNKDGGTVSISVSGAGNHNDNIFQIGERFTYTCEKSNTQSDYTNVVEVTWVGVTTGTTVNDTDPTEVVVTSTSGYDLALRKTLSSSTPGPFNTGDTVTFDVTVFNQGTVDANNIEVTDYIPTGLTLNDAAWTQSGDQATRTISSLAAGANTTLTITFTIDTDAPRIVKNLAEISSDDGDDCDSTPDNDPANDGIIDDNAIGTACEPGGDEDDHDIEEITIEDSSNDDYDLALRKTLVGATTVFSVGENVTFNIEVFNQGEVDAANVVVTDYIPTGLTLNDAAWTQSGNSATRAISFISAGDSENITITFTLNSNASDTIRNIAEISSDDGDDCDSTTDTDSGNDNLVDDSIGTRCDPDTTDEDDHDIAEITVDPTGSSACTNLTASPTSARNSLTSTLTCTGSGATSYLLEVRNSSNSVVFSSTNASDSVTLNTRDTYTASCFVNGETTTPSTCQQTLSVTWGGGWLEPTCSDVLQSGNQITCVGNREVEAFMLRCQLADGSESLLFDTTPTIINSKRREAVFTCDTGIAECLVNGTATDDPTHPRWEGRPSGVCSTDKVPYCGDGVLDTEAGEKCDFGAASDWGKCYKPPHAKACTFKDGWGGGWCNPEIEVCNVITLPNDGELIFGPAGDVIVGHGSNPLDQKGTPYLFNNSDYDLSFTQFCIKRTDSDYVGAEKALESGNVAGEYCANIGHEVIYGYEKIELSDYAIFPNYTGNKNGIPSAKDYGEAKLKVSIKSDIDRNGTIDELYDSYLSSELRVRVAKPAVITTGWGISYVKDSNTTGDVEKVTDGLSWDYDQNNNKNFVGTSTSDSVISSHADSITDSTAVDKVEDEKDNYEKAVDSVTNTTVGSGNAYFSDFGKYNGLDNVYIITGKNVIINSGDFVAPTEPTTYIVEGGNLTINENINSNANIAFVVKGWDIIIHKDVEEIDGTYISIPVWSPAIGGDIVGSGDTSTQLVVNGSLYGDISELVMTRHYISNDSGQLWVGTIVSFGSSLFTKPAPLVSQFIGEYLEAEKIAR